MSGIPSSAASFERTVGIFGGSFNPPHIAHVLAVQFALSAWPLGKIMVIPNFQHPLGKESASFEHRFRMAVLAFETLGSCVEVSRIEEELGGQSFTIDTVRELKRRNPGKEFRLILGSDLLRETHEWKDFEQLKVEAPPLIIPRLEVGGSAKVHKKAAFEKEQFYLPELSSSEIRGLIKTGADPGLRLPYAVMSYIKSQNLYL